MKELLSKIKEALISALPITAIVYILSLTPWFDFTCDEIISFSIGAVLLIIGIGFFNLGADLAMTPLITIQLLGFRAIVNEGYAEDVMDVAREQGARGGTILNARGVAREEAAAFFGISLNIEKEIVMMVVPKTIKDNILNAIYKEMGMEKKRRASPSACR